MLRTFSRWCTSLLFGLGLTATAYADNWNPSQQHYGFHEGLHHDGGMYHDGGTYHEGGCHEGAYYGGGCFDQCQDECCWRNGCFGLQIDALSWSAREENLHFGRKTFNFLNNNNCQQQHEKILRPSFGWDAGFRIGLHYLQRDNWDVAVIYTRFNSDSSKSQSIGPATNSSEAIFVGNEHVDVFSNGFFGNVFQKVHGSWQLDVNYIDFDFARTFACGSCLKIKPHFGARAFWMEQNWRIRAESFSGNEGALNDDLFKAHLKEHFWGYGVEGGLWGEMGLGCGVSLVGHFGGSILYSKFDISQFAEEELHAGTSNGTCLSNEVKDHIHAGIPSLDYFLGLQYGGCCCGSEYNLRVGWEQHIFFNMNQFVGCGNLALQGLTFSGQIDF